MKRLASKWDCEQLYYSELIEKNIIKRPDFQRLLDKDRVDGMVNAFINNVNKYNCLHTVEEITLAISSSCTWVIDGQHRLQCFKILHDEHKIDVIIDVRSVKVKNERGAYYWFSIVNKACPMPQLPNGMSSYAKPNELYIAIMNTFPQNPRRNKRGIFDDNVNVREPRMCKNTFITGIASYIKNKPLTVEVFINRVIELNNNVRMHVEKKDYDYFIIKDINWKQKTFDLRFRTCLEDCGGFCLGLFHRYAWIKMVFDKPVQRNNRIITSLKPHVIKAKGRNTEKIYPKKYIVMPSYFKNVTIIVLTVILIHTYFI